MLDSFGQWFLAVFLLIISCAAIWACTLPVDGPTFVATLLVAIFSGGSLFFFIGKKIHEDMAY